MEGEVPADESFKTFDVVPAGRDAADFDIFAARTREPPKCGVEEEQTQRSTPEIKG